MAGFSSSLAVLGLLRRCSNCGGRPPVVRGPAAAPAGGAVLSLPVAARAALRFLSRAACWICRGGKAEPGHSVHGQGQGDARGPASPGPTLRALPPTCFSHSATSSLKSICWALAMSRLAPSLDGGGA